MAYGTLSNANNYHSARNNVAWANASAPGETVRNGALQRASDSVDNKYRSRFPGSKTGGRAQIPEWPRKNVVIDGETLLDNEIPIEIEYATYELALLIIQGINPNPVVQGGTIKREKVKAGPVETETEYTDDVEAYDTFSIVDEILAPVLLAPTGAQYELLRA